MRRRSPGIWAISWSSSVSMRCRYSEEEEEEDVNVRQFNQRHSEDNSFRKDSSHEFRLQLHQLGERLVSGPNYITKNCRRFHYSSDRKRGRGRRLASRSPTRRAARSGLSHHICYLLLIFCHVIVPKCKLTAAKLSRKLTGPGVRRDSGAPERTPHPPPPAD